VTKVYGPTVLEAGSLRSRCQVGWSLPMAVREDLSLTFPLSLGHLLATFGIPWLGDASLGHHLHIHMAVSLGSCLQFSPFCKDTGHSGFGVHLLQCDLILTNYVIATLSPNKVTHSEVLEVRISTYEFGVKSFLSQSSFPRINVKSTLMGTRRMRESLYSSCKKQSRP
jgi:hypothetical protein